MTKKKPAYSAGSFSPGFFPVFFFGLPSHRGDRHFLFAQATGCSREENQVQPQSAQVC
jgi:hypothetical protein